MDEPVGECRVGLQYPNDLSQPVRLHIERADSLIYVAEEFLDLIERGKGHPDVSYGDGILTIRADNGTVSYGLGPLDYARLWRRGVRSGPMLEDDQA